MPPTETAARPSLQPSCTNRWRGCGWCMFRTRDSLRRSSICSRARCRRCSAAWSRSFRTSRRAGCARSRSPESGARRCCRQCRRSTNRVSPATRPDPGTASLLRRDTLGRIDKDASCSGWGTSLRLSAPHAALANGTQIQGFELDDVHRAGVLHVGAVVLPALLAIAELRRNLGGEEFLAAAVAGYEIGPRVGLCMGPEHIGQGWHSCATVGVVAAEAGAARGLSLSPEKAVHALG